MTEEQKFIELLDDFVKGKLSAIETAGLEEKMAGDAMLSKMAADHKAFIVAFTAYGKRKNIKEVIEGFGVELDSKLTKDVNHVAGPSFVQRYWQVTAIAAGVALMSVTATLWLMDVRTERTAVEYKELRRNVEQIKKSQTILLADLAKSKNSAAIPPTGKYAGTGVLISTNGFLITSYHVVKDADSIHIENEKFGTFNAEVVYSDPVNDVSVLKTNSAINTSKILPYAIVNKEAGLGARAFTLGYPREDIVFGEGYISASTGYRANANAYQISVPVNPGNSGGPLLNDEGDLIGIISGLQTETSGAAFAIKSTVLLEVLSQLRNESLKEYPLLPKSGSLRNLSRTEQVKRLKSMVFIVRVFK